MTSLSNPAPAIDTSAGRVDAAEILREAINEVMHYQFTHSRPAMHALGCLIDAAEGAAYELERLRAEVEALRAQSAS